MHGKSRNEIFTSNEFVISNRSAPPKQHTQSCNKTPPCSVLVLDAKHCSFFAATPDKIRLSSSFFSSLLCCQYRELGLKSNTRQSCRRRCCRYGAAARRYAAHKNHAEPAAAHHPGHFGVGCGRHVLPPAWFKSAGVMEELVNGEP